MSGSCELKTELTKLQREQRNLLIVAKNETVISEMLLSNEPLSEQNRIFLQTFLTETAKTQVGTKEDGTAIYKNAYKLALEIHDIFLKNSISDAQDIAREPAIQLKKIITSDSELSTKMQAVVLNKPDPKYASVDLAGKAEDIVSAIELLQGDSRVAKRKAKAKAALAEIDAKLKEEGLSKYQKAFLTSKRAILAAQERGLDLVYSLDVNKQWLQKENEKDGQYKTLGYKIFPQIMAVHEAYENKQNTNGGKTIDDRADEEASGYVAKKVSGLSIEGNTIVSMHNNEKDGSISFSHNKGDELSALSMLLGTTADKSLDATVTKIPLYLKNSIKINAISHMEDIYKALAYEPGSEEFQKVWDLDQYSDTYDTDVAQISYLHSLGTVPQSLILQSLGKAIYKSLPVKFSSEIDENLQEKAITELGLYALNYMNTIGLTREFNDFKDEAATEKAREKDSEAKVVNTNRFSYNGGSKNQIVIRVNINQDPESETYKKYYSGMVESKSVVPLISALQYLDVSEDRNLPSSEPITDPKKTIRNSFMDIPEEVEKKRILMQSKPLRFTSDMEKIWQLYKLDKNAAYALAGILSIDEKSSIHDQQKELSKINYSKMQFDEMITQYEEHWENEFYLPYDYTVSGRYMIDAILNPQESKITRFLVTSPDMQSVLHVNEDGKTFNAEDLHEFKLSVAQAFDLDPDKKLDSDVLSDLDKIVKISDDGKVEFAETLKDKNGKDIPNPFRVAAIELLKLDTLIANASTINENKDNTIDYSAEEKKVSAAIKGLIEPLMEANREGSGMHAIQAIESLIALSKHYSQSQKDGKLTEHVSNITIESDAITSGMILTLLGIGTKDALALAAKGGVYTKDTIAHWQKALDIFNEIARNNDEQEFVALKNKGGEFKLTHGWLLSFSKHVENVSKENKAVAEALALENHNMSFADFYNTVGKDANAGLIAIKDELQSDLAEAKAKYDEAVSSDADEKYLGFLQRQVENLKDSIAMSGFVGEITRSLAKSPVMVYIYGSMLSSIKQKLTDTIVVPKIYEVLNHASFNELGKETTFDGLKQILSSDKLTELIIKSEKNKADKRAAAGDKNAYKGLFTSDSARILKLALGDMLNVDGDGEMAYDEFGNMIGEDNYKAPRPQFKKFNGVEFVDIKDHGSQLLKNLVISPDMVKNLKYASDATLGSAFEEGFKQFKAIDDYRDSVKTLEVVRFSMFKYNYDKAIRKVITTLKPENGEYHISSGDASKIIAELEKSGFGHSVNDINGGKQPLYKKEKLMKDIQAVLDLGNNRISSSSIDSKNYAPNTGASGVITVHNIDGYIDSTSSAIFNLIRIYDGSVSGINKLEETGDKYNEATMHATKWSSYNTQANLVADGINKMIESGEFEEMLKAMSKLEKDGSLNIDKDNLLNTIEKLMGYKDVEFLDSADIDSKRDSVLERIAENIAVRKDADGNPTKLAMLHSYVTDLAEPQVMEMSDGSDYAINDGAIETIYDAYGKMLKSLQAYKRMQKYGDETVEKIRTVAHMRYVSSFKYEKERKNGEDMSGVIHPDFIKNESASMSKADLYPPIYLFADNLEHSGKTDSTGMHSVKSPNMIGIPVKKSSGNKLKNEFTTEEDIALAIKEIDKAFARIPKDRNVIYPSDYMSADKHIQDHINKKIAELKIINTKMSGHEHVVSESKDEQKDDKTTLPPSKVLKDKDIKKALEEKLGGTISQEKLDEIEDATKRCKK